MKAASQRLKARIADDATSPQWRLATITLMVAAALLATILAASASSSVTVSEPWVREAPPGMTVHAGYMKLINDGSEEIALTGAASPSYENVELHISKVVDGIATMQKVAQITVPPGKTVTFKPGGLHLMLIKPKSAIKLGQKVPIELTFSDGSTKTVEAEVKKGGGMPQMDHKMHHGPMDHGNMHHSG